MKIKSIELMYGDSENCLLSQNNWVIFPSASVPVYINIINLDSDIAAYRLIEKSNIVITVPFSTPSLIAKHLKIKSFYYDPTMLLSKDDRAAQGVKFISGYNELINIKIWIGFY